MSVSRFSEVISYAPNLNIKRREILDRLFSDEEIITKLTAERDKAISLMSKSWQHEPHGDELIYNHTKTLIDSIERKREAITKQAERIKELEDKNTDLLQSLYEIQSECIGELAMGYKVDAQGIGERISIVTGLTNPELLQLLERLR